MILEERTVSEKLDVKGKTINQIARWYFNDELYVNRKYQRKLVWSLDEKKLFIDSIINKFPTPSIMINDFKKKNGNEWIQRYEIIDGLQRLDAIFSFIRGDFGIKYHGKLLYFDISHIPSAKILLQDEKWVQQSDLLPDDVCSDFADSELPVILSGQNYEKIEEIFRRINSTGRKVSTQDLRQSGAVGDFPDLVRRIASRVRKDYTYDDSICLSDMPKISVGFKRFGYGVDIDTIFWRRHDLITISNIKQSKDEEIIETLVATVLLGESFKKSKDALDNLYNRGSVLNVKIESEIQKIGKDVLEDKFAKVFDIIDMIFDSVNSDFSSYLFIKKQVSGKDECFKILFLSIYKLLDEDFIILDYKTVASTIKSSTVIFNQFATSNKINYKKANESVTNLYTLLKPSFSRKIVRTASPLEREIDERLGYSKIESQMTEFKIGVSNFGLNTINDDCIDKISRTLVAMANTNNKKEEGYVIIGIANDKKSYDNWYNHYKQQAIIINQHYVPGIISEAKRLFKNSDNYIRELRKRISEQPISPKLKDYILSNFELINYHDVEVVVFKSKKVDEISLYNGIKYVRQGNETIKI